jgi:hypothetical protein
MSNKTKIGKKLTNIVHLFTSLQDSSPLKPLKSSSCTEKNTIPPFSATSGSSAIYLSTETVPQAIFSCSVHVKGVIGL